MAAGDTTDHGGSEGTEIRREQNSLPQRTQRNAEKSRHAGEKELHNFGAEEVAERKGLPTNFRKILRHAEVESAMQGEEERNLALRMVVFAQG